MLDYILTLPTVLFDRFRYVSSIIFLKHFGKKGPYKISISNSFKHLPDVPTRTQEKLTKRVARNEGARNIQPSCLGWMT